MRAKGMLQLARRLEKHEVELIKEMVQALSWGHDYAMR